MKFIFTYFVLFLTFFSSFGQTTTRPNVIVIYTDDQGAVDLGSYGSQDIYSPNLDKLAKEGTRFTQAYVAAPVCAPSRAALLTGKYPQNAGISSNTSARPGSHGMPNDQYTLAEMFRENGYKTGHIGKWHLGMSEETGPNAQGFDYSFGHLRGCIDNYSHYFFWEGPNIHDLYENGKEVFHEGKYFPDLASEKALQYVESNKNEPFFMYYAINMPHYPYQPTQKWRDHYQGMEQPRADYAAFISTIDERIGHLIDKLEKLGIRDNTIIVYQSDNGYSTEVRAFNGGGSSGPYRGAKSSLFEGGIRLPTLISWKGQLPEETVNDQFFINTDWMPTLAQLCQLKIQPSNIDGMDQSEMIINPSAKTKRSSAFWKYGSQWVVRKGKWKLIGYPSDTSHKGELDLDRDALFLSDLDSDVSEMVNLAEQYPEIVRELIAEYIAWEHGNESEVPKKTTAIDHLAKGLDITANSPIHHKYKNIEVLIDGKRGFPNYRTGQWVGHEGKDLEFIIKLKDTTAISNVGISYLHSPTNWIFGPKSFEISFSDDGLKYGKKEIIERNILKEKNENYSEILSSKLKAKAKYVKIKINGLGTCPAGFPCEGGKVWLFIDEIIVE